MLDKNDLNNTHLNFDNNVIINEENAVYFAPNGLGKTTIYSLFKRKHPLYGYFSYDDCKEKIIKEKKKIIISIRTTDIEKLMQEKEKILNELDIKQKGFKEYSITSEQTASNYSQYCKTCYKNHEYAILNFKKDNIAVFDDIEEDKKIFILKNIENIKKICVTGSELENIKNAYLSDALKLLENAVSEEETTCPVCGHVHNISILKIIKKKEDEYEHSLNSVIKEYMICTNKNKSVIMKDILEMLDIVKKHSLEEKDATNYIILGKNQNNLQSILDAKEKIIKINEKLKKLEDERDTFYKNLDSNWTEVVKALNLAFNDNSIKICKSPSEKKIEITLKRNASTYSTGELNYIVFLINILEFEYSNKENIIIDDPLSSYDIKKQYEIIFEIISRLINKSKTVIIFTHNINFINILNTQYSGKFSYYFLDKFVSNIKKFIVNLDESDNIFSIDKLLNYLPKGSNESKWINLLIDKDTSWSPSSDKHKLFHYDGDYIEEETKFSNLDLYNMIEKLDKIEESNFEILCAKKIILLSAVRVWIEKKLFDNFNGKINGKTLFQKLNFYFKNNNNWKRNLNINREDLIRKKVMLNQNSHYKSQIIPFQYALSITTSDLIQDIIEIKKNFNHGD